MPEKLKCSDPDCRNFNMTISSTHVHIRKCPDILCKEKNTYCIQYDLNGNFVPSSHTHKY